MRSAAALLVAFLMLAGGVPAGSAQQSTTPLPACGGRVSRIGDASVFWVMGPSEDRSSLDRWCRGVGPPLYLPSPPHLGGTTPPSLEELVVVTWNAHLAEGRLRDLVDALKSGRLTGRPQPHFVLLLQELYRRGAEVPMFAANVRGAYAIRARDPRSPDARDHALGLGVSMLYVPSMRNGAELLEDRGNAIVSSEPLSGGIAYELPFERQRRVAVGASIQVMVGNVARTLRLMNTHLDPLSSPKSLWIFRNPRTRQIQGLLDLIRGSRFEDDVAWAGTVLGGDFNTIQGGVEESAYQSARAWGHSIVREDLRSTHHMGKIDHLFFRLPTGWVGSTTRVDRKFGSDHHPVLGRFSKGRLTN